MTAANEMERVAVYVPTGEAVRRLHRHADRLRAMRDRKEIEVIRTSTGRLLWNVDGFIARKAAERRAT